MKNTTSHITNLSEAIEATDTMQIVDYFKVPYQKKGGKTWILCPGHDDHTIGSCYLDTKQNDGYYCHACHRYVKKWEMVQQLAPQWTKSQIFDFFFMISGVQKKTEEVNVDDPGTKLRSFMKELAKLYPHRELWEPQHPCVKQEATFPIQIYGGEYYSAVRTSDNMLMTVFREDRAAFRQVVTAMLDGRQENLEKMVRACSEGTTAFAGSILAEAQSQLGMVAGLREKLNSL